MTAFANRVFVFTGATLEQALAQWERDQRSVYPHQKERIRITALAMRDFFESRQIDAYKMTLRSQRDD